MCCCVDVPIFKGFTSNKKESKISSMRSSNERVSVVGSLVSGLSGSLLSDFSSLESLLRVREEGRFRNEEAADFAFGLVGPAAAESVMASLRECML